MIPWIPILARRNDFFRLGYTSQLFALINEMQRPDPLPLDLQIKNLILINCAEDAHELTKFLACDYSRVLSLFGASITISPVPGVTPKKATVI